MKKLLLTSVGLLALGIASASATDLPRRQVMPAKAPVYVAPAPYDWTGIYVGVSGGGAWGRSDFSTPLATGTFDLSGGVASGTLGYNYQAGQLVVGIEGDMGVSSIRGSTACGTTTCATHNDALGTVRGRFGYAIDRFMPYVTGGLAFGNIRTSVAGFGDASENKNRGALGGGIEAAVAGPWTAKVEYLYVDLGRGGSILGSDARFKANIVRAGLNYRF